MTGFLRTRHFAYSHRLAAVLFYLCISFLIPTNVCSAAEKMTFKVASGGNDIVCGRQCGGWVSAEGDITPESHLELAKLRGFGKGTKFYLNSNGGSLLGGLMLGQVLREFEAHVSIGVTTTHRYTGETLRVLTERANKGSPLNPNWKPDESYFSYDVVDEEGVCLSACAYAFFGGMQREVPGKAKLGLHQFFSDEAVRDPLSKQFTSYDLSRQQQLTALVADYVGKMGVDTVVVSLASRTPPANMYILARDELIKFRVITLGGEIHSEWKLEPFGKGLFVSKTATDTSNIPRPPSKTLGFYCKSDHPKDLIAVYIHDFGSQLDRDRPWPHSIVHSLKVAAGSFKVSMDKSSGRVLRTWVTKESAQGIAVYLERDALLQGLRSAAKISVSLELPMTHGLWADGDFDARNLPNLLDLVLKNCAY
jgi:hypothetical protein